MQKRLVFRCIGIYETCIRRSGYRASGMGILIIDDRSAFKLNRKMDIIENVRGEIECYIVITWKHL